MLHIGTCIYCDMYYAKLLFPWKFCTQINQKDLYRIRTFQIQLSPDLACGLKEDKTIPYSCNSSISQIAFNSTFCMIDVITFQTLNCCWSSEMQGICPKICKALVISCALASYQLNHLYLFWINPPSPSSALLLCYDDTKYWSIWILCRMRHIAMQFCCCEDFVASHT